MKEFGKSVAEKYIQILANKAYSNRTIKSYTKCVIDFIELCNKNPYKLNKSDLSNYLLNYNYTSRSQQNQIISSLRLYYKYILNIKVLKINGIERPRKAKTLPKVIDKDYIIKCLYQITNTKHLAILSLAYSVGLRVSEVTSLKLEDIDSDRMVINIRNAKGNKDRVVPLSQSILILLRKYYKEYRPYRYLFNGQNSLKYSPGSCNKIVKKHLGNKYHMHQLRHSSFTSMLESGTDISIIQKIAGHAKTDTTRIYAQVSTQLLKKAVLPI